MNYNLQVLKVLWITSTPFPKPCKELGLAVPFTGGWLFGLAERLAGCRDIRIAVATAYKGEAIRYIELDNIGYYFIPTGTQTRYQKDMEPLWRKVCEEFKPDLVHIHGTEYTAGLACMRSNPSLKYIISIQGLVSVYSRYYNSGINNWEIYRNITFRDIVKRDTLFSAQRKFAKRGLYEKEYLLKSNHIIGRTQWDFAHAKAVNPAVTYHFCNESLRSNFYTAQKWDIKAKVDYSIFLSQAAYPLKGLHQVIKAISFLKSEFPTIRLRIAGVSMVKHKTFLEKIKLRGYGAYLLNLIIKYDIEKNIHFTGPLDENSMVSEFQSAHIFICPSSIENSPNSLGEAQLIGVPVIGSFVGGTPDMIEHEKTGLLYRFEEIEMLAENIRRIFNDDQFANQLSLNEIVVAEKRHDSNINLIKAKEIYRKIIQSDISV